ncbi:hypothetical protein PUNSTDRAFT_49173 [Punctularia strigosozonata HHB-11173 SS5]|uniref:uncharacterized protein n=1 Tax=Punctularia strigosozonata (strain HHB-11173) TaxID=741275 RepID=UPI000441748D|nr:uncharacterized protein PUNSTDRAFT_49173 [Punctularia strigosozonata HHB-11173 SS5]EIN14352.1 hypothetical protein PUNSTDRAFT_49173 [Punctularia strigosozonata HHB-11173 SS5]
MVDPDAPTPQEPTNAQIRHFVGGGFILAGQPSKAGTPLVNITPALSEYRQPSPPNTSDPHINTFLLFKQPPNFPQSLAAANLTSDVTLFNITAFAEKLGLEIP